MLHEVRCSLYSEPLLPWLHIQLIWVQGDLQKISVSWILHTQRIKCGQIARVTTVPTLLVFFSVPCYKVIVPTLHKYFTVYIIIHFYFPLHLVSVVVVVVIVAAAANAIITIALVVVMVVVVIMLSQWPAAFKNTINIYWWDTCYEVHYRCWQFLLFLAKLPQNQNTVIPQTTSFHLTSLSTYVIFSQTLY